MSNSPDSRGRFGIHGGQYIPETLMNAVLELEEAYDRYRDDPAFVAELENLLNTYAGRPSLLYCARNMTRDLGGAKVYLKREDLNHTGAHKINNVLGQALLAQRMGKTRLIAETGAGQHGVATATAWDPSWGHTRFPRWCATSRPSSRARRASSAWRPRAGCPTRCWPA